MRAFRCGALCALLVAAAAPARAAEAEAGGPGAPADPAPVVRPNAHLLVVVEMDGEGTKVGYARRVDLPLPPARKGSWQVEVLDGSGAAIHRAPLRDPGVVRGEFADAEGRWERVELRPAKVAFALRLPLIDGAAQVRILAPARDLPAGAARADDALVEAGAFAWPEVER